MCLFWNGDKKARAGVLVLHGSEGGACGLHDETASFLAAHGYVALAHDWCGSPRYPTYGVPQDVTDIDIDRPAEALTWLRTHPLVPKEQVAIYGYSRGAELALIMATLSPGKNLPKPAAVAVTAPTDYIVEGFSWNWKKYGGITPDLESAKAWRWRGEYLNPGDPIEIEKYGGPVLLMHGNNDSVWAVERSRALEERLKTAHYPAKTLYLPDEEHSLSPRGRYQERKTLVEFLDQHLVQEAATLGATSERLA